jgi:hypothetical protein
VVDLFCAAVSSKEAKRSVAGAACSDDGFWAAVSVSLVTLGEASGVVGLGVAVCEGGRERGGREGERGEGGREGVQRKSQEHVGEQLRNLTLYMDIRLRLCEPAKLQAGVQASASWCTSLSMLYYIAQCVEAAGTRDWNRLNLSCGPKLRSCGPKKL